MKKVKWIPKGSRISAFVDIGSFRLNCYKIVLLRRKPRWFARVYICGQTSSVRFGPKRYSLAKTKEDAIRIMGEILLDYKVGLESEVQNYDAYSGFVFWINVFHIVVRRRR